uniref:Uncharacterized protein n=1 Tax=Calidris pygmaea TaxID=425635 RepID=A0A8C3JKN9_9CHAR
MVKVRLQCLKSVLLPQVRPDGAVQLTRTYTPKELREYLEVYQQRSGENILAWLLRVWDGAAASIHLILSEKDLLSPITTDDNIRRAYIQLQNITGPDGQDIVAPTLYQWLCAVVLIAHPDPSQLAASLGPWHTIAEGITVLRQIGMAHALAMGANPDDVLVTKVMRMQFLKQASESLKPLIVSTVTDATGTIGALVNKLREIGDTMSGPSVRVINRRKQTKSNGATARITRKQIWADLVQAGVPRSEIEGITTSEMFRRWHKLAFTWKNRLVSSPPRTPCPPSPPSAPLRPDSNWQMPKQQK